MKRGKAWVRAGVAFGLCGVSFSTLALAVDAWRKTELESRMWRASWIEIVSKATRDHALELEREARDAAAIADKSEVVGHAHGGRFVGYAPLPTSEEPYVPSSDELHYYALSIRGGESYEAGGDSARAVDAYSFFLPRIQSPVLRARLRFAAARATEKAGAGALASALHRELFESAAGITTESGLPIDLLSALRLIENPGPHPEDIPRRILERLETGTSRASTSLLARIASALGDASGRLCALVQARRLLEKVLESAPEILTSREAVVVGNMIAVAKDELTGERTIRAASWERRPWTPETLERWTYGLTWGTQPPDVGDSGVAAEPITLRDGGPPLGHVAADGGSVFRVLRGLAQEGYTTQRVFVVIQVLSILGCSASLLILLRRERQVARLRDRLLANVSHELKTPVTSVRMFAELLGQAGLESGEAAAIRGHLRRESARLTQLVENLLDLSKPERVDAKLVREPVDVRALLLEISAGFSYRARDANVEIETRGLQGDAVVLQTNAAAIERIALNLLDNALKYRRPQGGRIALALESVNGGVRISVEDNGPGIPAQDRERVFDELFRGRFEDYGAQGMGLGLSIARRLARRLDGDVVLTSHEGLGSTFSLSLPTAERGGAVP